MRRTIRNVIGPGQADFGLAATIYQLRTCADVHKRLCTIRKGYLSIRVHVNDQASNRTYVHFSCYLGGEGPSGGRLKYASPVVRRRRLTSLEAQGHHHR